ncbi:MAG: CotH kinase family protein [Vicinamibacterales bacterium]
MQIRITVIALVAAVIVAGWLGLLSSHADRAEAPIRISPRVLAAQGFPGFRGQGFGGANREQELVSQYDKDGDRRLNRQERDAARSSTMPGGGFMRGFRFAAEGSPGRALAPADVRPYPTTSMYDLGTMRTMFLQFEDEDWEEELAAFNNTDVEVPATMTVDGRTYKGVGVHFRGASSFMMVPAGLKRSLNVSTDFTVEDQDLGGYRTFNLLNAANDPTFLRAFLYTQIARAYIPAPRMNFMRVVINGRSWGVYLNTQQFNGDLLRDDFKTSKGARWKVPGRPGGRGGLEYLGENIGPYRQIYEIKTKDDDESWKALVQLTKVLNETPAEKLEAALAPLLDIDATLKFLAIEVALVNSDGYWSRASDYNLYRDPDGRFHVIPHDVNEGLGGEGGGGGFGFGGGGPQLDPLVATNDPGKPLRSKLLAVPALRAKYLSYVHDIATRWLDWKTVYPLLKSAHDLIGPEVRLDTRKLYDVEGFEAGMAASNADNSLKSFLDSRRAFLLGRTAPGAAALRVDGSAAENFRAAAN